MGFIRLKFYLVLDTICNKGSKEVLYYIGLLA